MSWFSRFKTPSDILASSAHYDIKRHMAHVRELQLSYPLNTIKQIQLHTEHLIRAVCDGMQVSQPIKDAFDRAMTDLFIEDELYAFNVPTIELTEYLTRLQTVFTSTTLLEKADEAIVGIFLAILSKIPPTALTESNAITVPLHDLVPLPILIGTICNEIMTATDDGKPVFPSMRAKLLHNAIRANGLDPSLYDGKKPLKGPHELDLEPDKLIDTLLEGTRFPELLRVPVPFELTSRFHIIISSRPPTAGRPIY